MGLIVGRASVFIRAQFFVQVIVVGIIGSCLMLGWWKSESRDNPYVKQYKRLFILEDKRDIHETIDNFLCKIRCR
jgi:hypothetical protein